MTRYLHLVKNPKGGKNLASGLTGDCTGLQTIGVSMLTVMEQPTFSEK